MEGLCPCCEAKVTSKCGDIKLWHWAHYSKRDCDIWWENETQWHRDWKGVFPTDWQEVIHRADDGEKHIADVKTQHGCVLEFQHSFVSNEERSSRNDFYPNLVWVVDGLRRKRDKDQFFNALNSGAKLIASPLLIKISTDESIEHYKNLFEYQRKQSDRILRIHEKLVTSINELTNASVQRNIIEAKEKGVINDDWKPTD